MSNLTETITLKQFITKHGLRFECRRVESRPDGLISDAGMRHFRCRIAAPKSPIGNGRTAERSFSLYFSQGSAHTEEPILADVLDCLAMDASGYEDAKHVGCHENCNPFYNWASEYGYDPDSRKAERIFRTVKRQAEQLRRTLGAEAYEELLYNTERL